MKLNKIALILFIAYFLPIAAHAQETIEFGRFGTVTLYQSTPEPKHVVIFVSGDGGWNHDVIGIAETISQWDTLVIGVDVLHYLKELERSREHCVYPSGDFESLSKYIQKKKNFRDYISPVLLGYSSGATLVYATLVQAPPDTFAAGLGLGFCPDLKVTKPFCKGIGLEYEPETRRHGVRFLPATTLKNPFIAFQGLNDRECIPKATQKFMQQVKNGEIFTFKKVGHGFAVQKNWMPQFKEIFANLSQKIKAAGTPGVKTSEQPSPLHPVSPVVHPLINGKLENVDDLPLVEILPKQWKEDFMVLIISGDGGWASIDRSIGEFLAEDGIGVVGFNSLKYFWHRRTPEISATDLSRVLNHYAVSWKKNKILIIGYSLGADVLPFMVSRLKPEEKNLIEAVALLGPSPTVDFEFHLTDWLGGNSDTSVPVLPELEKLKGMKILCLCSEEEEVTLCKELPHGLARVFLLNGGHHFGGDYKKITDMILKEIR